MASVLLQSVLDMRVFQLSNDHHFFSVVLTIQLAALAVEVLWQSVTTVSRTSPRDPNHLLHLTMFVSLSYVLGSQVCPKLRIVGCTDVDNDSSDPPTPPSRSSAFLFGLLLFIFLLMEAELWRGF